MHDVDRDKILAYSRRGDETGDEDGTHGGDKDSGHHTASGWFEVE